MSVSQYRAGSDVSTSLKFDFNVKARNWWVMDDLQIQHAAGKQQHCRRKSSYATLRKIICSNQVAAYWYNIIRSVCHLSVLRHSYSIEKQRRTLPPGFSNDSLEGEVDFFTEVPVHSLHGSILLQGITAQFATCE